MSFLSTGHKIAKKATAIILSMTVAVTCIPDLSLITEAAENSASVLQVDLSESTGAVKHGANGFLYGIGHENIPSETTLSALNPQVTVQKPVGGTQHPGGSFEEVADMFFRSGGRQMQVYLQDWYSDWPYPYDIDDYAGLVERLIPYIKDTRAIMQEKYGDDIEFVYVTFNEPDYNWYGWDPSPQFLADWDRIYDIVKSQDPESQIIGPGFAIYTEGKMRAFLEHCVANGSVPDIICWHELQEDFYSNWYSRYENYRALEKSLGLEELPIDINEYLCTSQTLWNCGEIVQWISKFEDTKVEACRAYWSRNNSLNDLVTMTNNQVTGAWWLHKFYGEMTGDTVKVTPPDINAKGLQGLAALDTNKKQVKALVGGIAGLCSLELKNIDTEVFGNRVHAVVSRIDSAPVEFSPNASGVTMEPAVFHGPAAVIDANFDVSSDGSLNIPINLEDAKSAYQVIITPAAVKDTTNAEIEGRYEAEYAVTDGNIVYGDKDISGTGYVQEADGTDFIVNVEQDGYYIIDLSYQAGEEDVLNVVVEKNDIPLKMVMENGWSHAYAQVYLQAGVSRVSVRSTQEVKLDYLDICSGLINADLYEAEDGILSGNAQIREDGNSTGTAVDKIGNGTDNTLTFQVYAENAGIYRMAVNYTTDGQRSTGAGGYYDVIDRYAEISVNGGDTQGYYFKSTWEAENYRSTVINLQLQQGNNTIEFSNPIEQVDFTLAEIPRDPLEYYDKEELITEGTGYTYGNQWYDLEVNYQEPLRKVSYQAPAGSYGNINEIEFYTMVDGKEEKLDLSEAEIFGKKGIWQHPDQIGYTYAFDGDINTTFDCYYENGAYCGVDFGEGNEKLITKIRFYPRWNTDSTNNNSRVKGGKFIGNNGKDKTLDDNEYAPVIDYITIASVYQTLPDEYGKTDVTELTVENIPDQIYKGSAVTPAVTIMNGKNILQQGRDYTLKYSNNNAPGTGSILLSGTGKYYGDREITFRILEEQKKPDPLPTPVLKDISGLSIGAIGYQTADGRPKTVSIILKDGNYVLRNGIDYTVQYKNNIKPGKAEILATGKGNYKGTKSIGFEIVAGKNKTYTVGNLIYKVTNASVKSGEVSVYKAVKSNYTKMTIPRSVKIGNRTYKVVSIGNKAFKNNKKLKKVTIGSNIVNVGSSAFYGCKSLTTVKLGDKVKEVGNDAFRSCIKLNSISIGKNVRSIGKRAFYGDKALKKIVIKSTKLSKVGIKALKGVHKNASIKVAAKKKNVYMKLFKNKGQATSVKIIK